MKIKIFMLFVCVFIGMTNVSAQSESKKYTSWLDLTGSAGNKQGTAAFAYVYNRKLWKKKKFEAGLGVRFTSYFGKDKYFITAPAKLTSGKTGPTVFFIENIKENIDSILVSSSQTNALNLSLNLGYNITKKFYAGFNIDAVGFSFGKTVTPQFFSSNSSSNITFNASPTPFNALLVSDNDRGTLNSELFFLYRVHKTIGVKAGFQFLFTEYTTSINIQQQPEPNDRFRNKVVAFSLGITYKLK